MGALIISRYDRHPIGWLLSLVGIVSAISLLTEAYAYWVQEADGPGRDSLGGVAAWISALLGGQLAIAGAGPDVPAGPGRAPRSRDAGGTSRG